MNKLVIQQRAVYLVIKQVELWIDRHKNQDESLLEYLDKIISLARLSNWDKVSIWCELACHYIRVGNSVVSNHFIVKINQLAIER